MGFFYEINFNEMGFVLCYSKIVGIEFGFDFIYFFKKEGQIDYGVNVNFFIIKYFMINDVVIVIFDEVFFMQLGGYLNYKLVIMCFVVQLGICVEVYVFFQIVVFEL